MVLELDAELESVDRHLVHRAALSEVFVEGSRALSQERFYLQAQWPRRHYFFDMESGSVDLLLVAETLRQATILVAHRYFDVPMTDVFLMRGMTVELTGSTLPATFSPYAVEIDVRVTSVKSGSRGLTALHTDLSFRHEGVVIAEGSGDLQILEARLYGRMRPASRRSHELPLSPRPQELNRGLLLTPDTVHADAWQLHIDHRHPVFFDHPLDHVPGMVIIEAVRQLVSAPHGPTSPLRYFAGVFTAFLDLDSPVQIQSTETGPTGSNLLIEDDQRNFVVTQGGQRAATLIGA